MEPGITPGQKRASSFAHRSDAASGSEAGSSRTPRWSGRRRCVQSIPPCESAIAFGLATAGVDLGLVPIIQGHHLQEHRTYAGMVREFVRELSAECPESSDGRPSRTARKSSPIWRGTSQARSEAGPEEICSLRPHGRRSELDGSDRRS